MKNQSTLVSKAVKAVNCRQRFVLTGTPIENRLSELWNLFDFLMPGYLYSHRAFVEKLEKPIAKDTIEERILDLQDKKAELLDVLSNEGGSILEMSKDELLALLD